MRTPIKHKLGYALAHRIAPMILKKYDFKTDHLPPGDENYLVMANHLTEVDMFMLMAAFPKQMYFVAGEHLLRSKYGKLMQWLQDPIFEPKGASSLGAVREIIRRTGAGQSVALFPEGSRSFSGETLPLPDSVAKIAKRCGCGLVTYHIEGGYFVAPRWAYTFRVGPMRGKIVRVRSAEEVAATPVGELAEAINRELYENAYETQRKNRFRYYGERLAEGLENYLVKCPCCGGFDTLTSSGNSFRCTECGLAGTYTEEGFLEGDGLPFDSVCDWGQWAEAETDAYIRSAGDEEVCFRDEDVVLSRINADHGKQQICSDEITGFKDRFVVGEKVFQFSGITAISMLYYGKSLLFTCNGVYYEITGSRFHAIKYYKLFAGYSEDCHLKRG